MSPAETRRGCAARGDVVRGLSNGLTPGEAALVAGLAAAAALLVVPGAGVEVFLAI
jgi:hypothetical protein